MTEFLLGGYSADMGGSAEGVSLARLAGDGTIAVERLLVEATSPSWITVGGGRLYAALESRDRIASWRLTRDESNTVVANAATEHDAGGVSPCHLALDGDELLVAAYGDGAVIAHRLDAEGAPQSGAHALPGEGSGPLAAQQGPHAHHVLVLADGALLSVDLGSDEVHLHRRSGEGRWMRRSSLTLPPGTGPRDLLDLGEGRLVVSGEWGRDAHLIRREGDALEILDRVGLPGAAESDQAAGLVPAPGGRVVVGLRGSDRVAQLVVDGDQLLAERWMPLPGSWPRHLLAHEGLLHVSLERSDLVASFRLGELGDLELLGARPAPSPTCVTPLGV